MVKHGYLPPEDQKETPATATPIPLRHPPSSFLHMLNHFLTP